MLKENASILEFYRRQAQANASVSASAAQSGIPAAPAAPSRHSHVLAVVPPTHIRLRAPTDVSTVHGMSGAAYVCDATHCIQAKREDAQALINIGFQPAPLEERPPPISRSSLTHKRRALLDASSLMQVDLDFISPKIGREEAQLYGTLAAALRGSIRQVERDKAERLSILNRLCPERKRHKSP
jgi:hypothetical protein